MLWQDWQDQHIGGWTSSEASCIFPYILHRVDGETQQKNKVIHKPGDFHNKPLPVEYWCSTSLFPLVPFEFLHKNTLKYVTEMLST